MARKRKRTTGKQEAAPKPNAWKGPEGSPPEPRTPGEDLLSAEDWLLVAQRFGLSAREITVAVLLFEGKKRSQVVRRLSCAPSTVRVYIDRLFKKLQVRDRVGLVLRIVRVILTDKRTTE